MEKMKFKDQKEIVIKELNASLSLVEDDKIEQLIIDILSAEKVFFVGVGRVMLSLQSICKRWAHLGINAHYVGEITEPAITNKDILIVGSGSGTTLFPVAIAKKAHSIGAKIIHIGSSQNNSITDITDLMIRIPVQTKYYLADEVKSEQPMTSLFEQSLLLLGDTIAMMIVKHKNLDMKALWQYHANLE